MNKKEIAGGLLIGMAMYFAGRFSPEPVQKEFAKFNSNNDISQEFTQFIHNAEAVPFGGTPLLGVSQQHRTKYLIENTDARGAELDVHNVDGELVVRHGEYKALIGDKPPKLKDVLTDISEALSQNPRAFTIKIDDFALSDKDKKKALKEVETHFGSQVWDKSDQTSYAFTNSSAWPSEKELLASKKPIIIQNQHDQPLGYSADWMPEYLENEDRSFIGRASRWFDISGAVDKFSVENTPELAENGGALNFDNMQPKEARTHQRSMFDPKMSMFSAVTPYTPQTKDGNSAMFGFSGALASLAALAGISVINKELEKKRKEEPYNSGQNETLASKATGFVDKYALPVSAVGKAALQIGSVFPEQKYNAMTYVAGASVALLVANKALKTYKNRSESEDMEQTLPFRDINIELPQYTENAANPPIEPPPPEGFDYTPPPREQEHHRQNDLHKPDYDEGYFKRTTTAPELRSAIDGLNDTSWDQERIQGSDDTLPAAPLNPENNFNEITLAQEREQNRPDALRIPTSNASNASDYEAEMAANIRDATQKLNEYIDLEAQTNPELYDDEDDFARVTTASELREAIDATNAPSQNQASNQTEHDANSTSDDASQRTAKTPEELSIDRARGVATALVATMAISSIRGDDEYQSKLGTSIASAGVAMLFAKDAFVDMSHFINPEKDGDSRAMAGAKAGIKMATAAMTVAQHTESKTIQSGSMIEGICVIAAATGLGVATLSIGTEVVSRTAKKATESVSHVARLAKERIDAARNPSRAEF